MRRYIPELEWNVREQGRCIPELEWNAPAHGLFHAALGMYRRAQGRYMHELEWNSRAQGLFHAALGMHLPALAPMAAMQRGLIWRQVLVSMGLCQMKHKPHPHPQQRGRR
jgi:hypothetical protein